jgi:hypothetical protein
MHRLTLRGLPPTVIIGTPFSSEDRALLFPDGWIAVVRLQPYRVDWRRPDGHWVRGPLLPFHPRRVTAQERVWAMTRAYGRALRDTEQLSGWPEIVPPFLSWNRGRAPVLLALPDGRLAIARTPTASDSTNRYDLVDRTGALTAVLRLPPYEAIVGFGARSVYVVATDEDDAQRLRRHPWP